MNAAGDCPLCAGRCAGAVLAPLLVPQLIWLWGRIADVADKRGDPDLTTGFLTVTAPASPEERAAAIGLLGGASLLGGAIRRVDLVNLTSKVRLRGVSLTPGAVAAHATGRALAVKAQSKAARADLAGRLQDHLEERVASLPAHAQQRVLPDGLWARLSQSGWVARVLKEPDPFALMDEAVSVLARLPADGGRIDRRTLVPGRPHALDEGVLPGLVLTLTGVSGQRPRAAWEALDVDIDNLMGGLLVLGLHPTGWQLPPDAVVTLPPRVLAAITWAPPPTRGEWAFVTENPSVVAAAADLMTTPGTRPLRLVCTVGTPSAVEVLAVGRLAHAGWRTAIRADFDTKGLAHVRALLGASPNAVPWRMGNADYLASGPGAPTGLAISPADCPWDPDLAAVMTETGAPCFEEALLPDLLHDLLTGAPGTSGTTTEPAFPVAPEATARWIVWRQDDNGNECEVSRHGSEPEAQEVADGMAHRGHKQIYWISAARSK
jgi:uncharacterized protein (TIGR02679 family)